MTPPRDFHCGVPWQLSPHLAATAIAKLRLRSWLTWMPDAPLPMAWNMDASTFEAARAEPGRFFLLLNEPEATNQANLPVYVAAHMIGKWQTEFGNDWAAPGVLLGVEGYAWLDAYRHFDGVIPAMWHVHIYAHSPADFADQWRRWKEWMRKHGVERETIVSECASWGPSPVEQMQVMDTVYSHLQSEPLLHSAYWFSANCSENPAFSWWRRSDLVDGNGNLTMVGQHYLSLTYAVGGAGELTNDLYLPVVQARGDPSET